MLYYDVRFGKNKGLRLTPHRFQTGLSGPVGGNSVHTGLCIPKVSLYATSGKAGASEWATPKQVILRALSLLTQSKDGNSTKRAA